MGQLLERAEHVCYLRGIDPPTWQHKLKHAGIIRRIIDRGWEVDPQEWMPLSAPFDLIRNAISASGASTRDERIRAYLDSLAGRVDFHQIADLVNQASVMTETPLTADGQPNYSNAPAPEPIYRTPDDLRREAGQGARDAAASPMAATGPTPAPSRLGSGEISKLAALPKPAEPRKITVLPAWEADSPPAPRSWVVTDLITQGSLSIVFGKEGSKKTYAMLDLAVCAAMGKPWLGFETQPTATLWVDEESGQDRWWARRFQVMSAHDAPKSLPLSSAVMQRFNLRAPGEAFQLGELILQTQAGLVVVDALMDVVPGADENAVRDMLPVLRDLRTLCEATGAAIIVIHHTNKVGSIRGSSAIPGQVDLTLKVESRATSAQIEFSTEKTRDIAATQFAGRIHFEPVGPRPERVWLEAAEVKAAGAGSAGISKAGRFVLAHLRAHGERSSKLIMNAATDVPSSTARKAIYAMIAAGLVKRVDGGGQGKEAKFELTETGKVIV